ncbi:hypothetical protein ME784_16210 [Lactobacillus delbrueckii]|nr:hypothetical protein ME784_16210 [Lactobacillus delbrueckii]GHN22936.1 hypothetical protein ME785_14940 [Lactobacillus delbrueckii]GHN62423.1 hypothetical protein ME807_08300 [Lactobacillus delbrueckii]
MQQFTPILLGSDINVYGMARSFHEAYGIKVQAWGASTLAPTRYSKIVDIEVHPGLTEDPEFIKVMREKIKEYKKHPEPVILISCGDGYSDANFPGFYNSSHISFMHDFPEMRGSQL